MKTISSMLNAVLIILIVGIPQAAQSDSDAAILQSMQQQIEALQSRVEALEAVAPTFTSLMPNFAERFHVMHLAGDAGDWAVAGHELQELQRLIAISDKIDKKNGELMQNMMTPSFQAVASAIEHGNDEKFQSALNQSIVACNACHKVAGSPFIQVTLDARESISLRHPHALSKSHMAGGHTH